MRRFRLWVPVIIVVAAAAGWWAWRSGLFARAVPVDAARVQRITLEVTLPVTGVYETRSVDLAFELPGRLAAVGVREGQQVPQGAGLASLDDRELVALAAQAEAAAQAARQQALQAEAAHRAAQTYLAQLQAGARSTELRQAEAALEAARVALDQARRHLAGQEQLFREGALSQAQLHAARAEHAGAQARYEQAVAQRDTVRGGARPEAVQAAAEQVRQSEAAWRAALAGIDQARAAATAARVRADRAHLRAPFDAVITRVYFHIGAPVGPGVPVVSLASQTGWITADVDEADIGGVRLDQPARITADAYPGVTLRGRVAHIGDQVDVRLGNRSVRVRVELDAPARMRTGTSVDVDILIQVVPDALVVPIEAMTADENGSAQVFVIAGGILRRRVIETGARNEIFVAIRSGLTDGELVALAEPVVLRSGLRVRPRVVP